MRRAKIYIPTKTALQSGKGKIKNWILKFKTKDTKTNSLVGLIKFQLNGSMIRWFNF